MLRKLILLPLVLALLAVSLGGCSGKSKSDAPKSSDNPSKEAPPKKLTPGGAGGKQPGPGSSSQ